MPSSPNPTSADPAEIAAFEAQAAHWWDPAGPHAPLHKLNPARLSYIRDRIAARAGRDPLAERPLAGLSILDVGCGGGLVCEPLARLGAAVTGLDAGAQAIAAAMEHAAAMGLAIAYERADVADFRGEFDAVLALEIVEHVADADAFLGACAARVKPGGVLIVSTLNRTWKAYALAIVGAERVLRWVPKGTHRWSRFVTPAELARALRRHGMRVTDVTGLTYDVARDAWRLGINTGVNYLATAV
jgi:2-polyprenyl-6-hydroxyphenyl methylase / 3-demethylubiquinone-9 3-methyltransferase